MESYKEEKIVSWSGKMRFSNHLQMLERRIGITPLG
jgi:hypothetical protein